MKNITRTYFLVGLVSMAVLSQAQAQQAIHVGNADGTPVTQADIMKDVLGSYIKGSVAYEDAAWPLFIGAADAGLCKDTVYRTGYAPRVIEAKMEEAYIGSTGIIPGVTVHFVVPNSPAAQAGLKENDQIVTINGRSTPTTGKSISKKFAEQFQEAVDSAGSSAGLVELEVKQGADVNRISFKAVKSCNLTISSLPDAGRFTEEPDPSQVMVSQTVMEQASDDVERQIVLAYAMSKNLSGAVAAKRNINRFAKLLDTAVQLAPLALPVSPSMLGFGSTAAMIAPTGSAAANLFSGSMTGKNDQISLAILKSAGISAQQVVAFWEKYMASDSNAMVLKWVNGSAMSKSRLDTIRQAAAIEQTVTAQAN